MRLISRHRPAMQWALYAAAFVAVIAVSFIALKFFKGSMSGSKNDVPNISAGSHVIGNLSAPVRLYVYTDFECPHCKKFHESHLPRLLQKYGNKIVIIYKNFPRDEHPGAYLKAQAAECVAKTAGEGAYWRYVKQLFATEPPETQPDVADAPYKAASSVGVDVNAVRTCVTSGGGTASVDSDLVEIKELGGTATPTIYVTGKGKSFLVQGDRGSQTNVAIEDILSS